MNKQADLELFIIDYLSNHIDELEEEYNKYQLDIVIDDIEKVIYGNPLADEIMTAIKDADYSIGNCDVFSMAIGSISNKLGYR